MDETTPSRFQDVLEAFGDRPDMRHMSYEGMMELKVDWAVLKG